MFRSMCVSFGTSIYLFVIDVQVVMAQQKPLKDRIPNGSLDDSAPGGATLNTMIGWSKLWGAGSAMLILIIGAIIYGASKMSNNPHGQQAGGRFLWGGLAVAAIVGAAPFLVLTAIQIGTDFK